MWTLVDPDTRYQASLMQALQEFATAGDFPHGSSLTPDSEQGEGPTIWRVQKLSDPPYFAGFVEYLKRCGDQQWPRHYQRVPSTQRWIIEDDTFIGFTSLRHELNDYQLMRGGHIGYSVRPCARRRGIATWALGHNLLHARSLGITKALVTCDDTNEASAAVITAHGGILENIVNGVRRYWITT